MKGRRIGAIRYDPEAERLNVDLWFDKTIFLLPLPNSAKDYITLNVSETRKKDQYVGQNSYGASFDVNRYTYESYELVLTNVDPKRENQSLISYQVNIPPADARLLKDDLEFYVDILIVELKDSDDPNFKRLYRKMYSQAPTSQLPTESVLDHRYLYARLIGVGIYRKTGGEVLKEWSIK